MTLREACKILDIWPVAKVWAEVWSNSKHVNVQAIDNIISIAKSNFRRLALHHHPDKGGDKDVYISIQNAYNLVKSATVYNFIDSLKEESNKMNLEQVNTPIAC